MGMANSVPAQIGEVSDEPDDGQAAGLPAAETQSQHRFDTAVGVDVLTGVTRECGLGDGPNNCGLVKWASPAPASARPEKRATRLLLRDITFRSPP